MVSELSILQVVSGQDVSEHAGVENEQATNVKQFQFTLGAAWSRSAHLAQICKHAIYYHRFVVPGLGTIRVKPDVSEQNSRLEAGGALSHNWFALSNSNLGTKNFQLLQRVAEELEDNY